MLNDIYLVKVDERVENRESGIVENASENNVLEILQPVRVVDFLAYGLVFDFNNLLELGFVGEVLPVVGLV